ncbi:MAG: hypothetical protein DI565_07480 [Ancylobacter novellus]|uniref:Uncharacterized protein n=1 Tax=Ancylobacter novellus TaxID=921 RepID=A0A2W5KJW4_ANCNO|nr:MAG: hypothetical protein DI565_07480 [Ancylobacter novellus]
MTNSTSAGEFKAWINLQPGSDNALHVTGKVTTPSSGWSGRLVEAVPPGINPAILILDAELTPPSDVVTVIELTYAKPHSPHYESATIRGLGGDIHVPVEYVH